MTLMTTSTQQETLPPLVALGASPSVSRSFLLKQILYTFIFALIALFLAEIACRYLFLANSRHESYAIQAYMTKLSIARNLPEKPTILLLGDSHMDFAGYSELINKELADSGKQYQVANLASPSVTPDLSLTMLKAAKQSKADIKIAIININTRHFDKNALADPEATISGNLKKTYEGKCILNSPTGTWEQVNCQLQSKLYLMRHHNQLKNKLLQLSDTVFKPDSLQQQRKIDIYPANEVSPMGWAPGYPLLTRETMPKKGYPNYKHIWTEEPLDRFLSYCKAQNIKPILVILPFHASNGIRIVVPSEIFIARVERYAQNHHVLFWNLMSSLDHENYFSNSDHVSAIGAIKVSQIMAGKLEQVLREQEQ